MLFWRARLPFLIHHHFMRRQTKPKSVSKQRINSDAIFFICSTRPRAVNSSMTGETGDRSYNDLWNDLVQLHFTSCQCLFSQVWQSLPPRCQKAPSGSMKPIILRHHGKQHLTAMVAMGVLPCDHPQRGTGEVRPSSATLPGLLGLSFDHGKGFLCFIVKIQAITHTNHNEPL